MKTHTLEDGKKNRLYGRNENKFTPNSFIYVLAREITRKLPETFDRGGSVARKNLACCARLQDLFGLQNEDKRRP